MSLALKLALGPLLLVQALATRRRAPVLPEADGAREGRIGGAGSELRVLIAGDSSAAGVGVARQEQALSGHLSRCLHRATQRAVWWQLHARSGLTTAQVHQLLREQQLPAFDVAVVVTGVNDVIDQVPVARALGHRIELADWLLRERGLRHVVFAPLPPVHRFPLLPQPLRAVMGRDARAHDRALARWAATRDGVSHARIDFEPGPDAMASDGFHPGEPVYRVCGEALAQHITQLQGTAP